VLYLDDEPYIVVVGGWDGTKSLFNCEVFKVMFNSGVPFLHQILIDDFSIPRNRPCSIII
jgi:hypothetical protein